MTLILDNEELGSKTYGYFNGGEMAVELVDKTCTSQRVVTALTLR